MTVPAADVLRLNVRSANSPRFEDETSQWNECSNSNEHGVLQTLQLGQIADNDDDLVATTRRTYDSHHREQLSLQMEKMKRQQQQQNKTSEYNSPSWKSSSKASPRAYINQGAMIPEQRAPGKTITPPHDDRNVTVNDYPITVGTDDQQQKDIAFSLENLHKTYLMGLMGVPALRGVSLDVHRGDFLIIYGMSGGGKSTLLNILGTIDAPTKGNMTMAFPPKKSNQALSDAPVHVRISERTDDHVLAYLRNKKIGFVFQNFNLLPSMSALENVMLPAIIGGGVSDDDDEDDYDQYQENRDHALVDIVRDVDRAYIAQRNQSTIFPSGNEDEVAVPTRAAASTDNTDVRGTQQKERRKQSGDPMKRRAQALLRLVGLGDRMEHRPSMLSGGEQQRVTIARALMNKPDVLLLDEPTGDLDSRNAHLVMAILLRLNMGVSSRRAKPITMVMVTHDVYAKQYANRILYLRDGKVGRIEDCDPVSRLNAVNSLRRIVRGEQRQLQQSKGGDKAMSHLDFLGLHEDYDGHDEVPIQNHTVRNLHCEDNELTRSVRAPTDYGTHFVHSKQKVNNHKTVAAEPTCPANKDRDQQEFQQQKRRQKDVLQDANLRLFQKLFPPHKV